LARSELVSFRTRVAIAAAVLVGLPPLVFVSTVQAHATIGSVAWDNPNNPTKVIATSRGDDIANEPGTFSLTVYDPSGRDITAGATVVTGPKTMEVAVRQPTAQGQYRVAWRTRSDDGHDASGNISLQLHAAPAAPAATAPAAPAPVTSPVSPPSTGDGGLAAGSGGLVGLAAVAAAMLASATFLIRRQSA
jgi:methionine-rich copper-binding protein CopC